MCRSTYGSFTSSDAVVSSPSAQFPGKPSDTCPTIGCEEPRNAVAYVEMGGLKRASTACRKHVRFYAAREISRLELVLDPQINERRFRDGT